MSHDLFGPKMLEKSAKIVFVYPYVIMSDIGEGLDLNTFQDHSGIFELHLTIIFLATLE